MDGDCEHNTKQGGVRVVIQNNRDEMIGVKLERFLNVKAMSAEVLTASLVETDEKNMLSVIMVKELLNEYTFHAGDTQM